MKQNRLKMNPGKNKCILIGNKTQLLKRVTESMSVDGKLVNKSNVIKFLGLYLDELLTMRRHIAEVCRQANGILHGIRNIKKYLTEQACHRRISALVI